MKNVFQDTLGSVCFRRHSASSSRRAHLMIAGVHRGATAGTPGNLCQPNATMRRARRLPPRQLTRKCFPLELGCKPGSVPALVASRGWWSFIWAVRCRPARATNLGSGVGAGHAGGFPRDPYSVLLRVGFALPLLSPGERCALTTPFHPCPVTRLPARLAVYFLLHFPSSHLDWPLASTLPKEPGLSSTAKLRRRDHLSSSSGKQGGV
jgi:hypothetical protein